MFEFEFTRGDVHYTYNFDLLVAVIAITLALTVIIPLIRLYQLKKTIRMLMCGNYDNAVNRGKKLLYLFQKYNNRRSTKSTRKNLDTVNFILAIAYFSKSEYENFLKHINAVREVQDAKTFWLTVYYINHDEIELAYEHLNNLNNMKTTKISIEFCQSYLMYKNGEIKRAKETMKDIYPNLNYSVLKEIAKEILS